MIKKRMLKKKYKLWELNSSVIQKIYKVTVGCFLLLLLEILRELNTFRVTDYEIRSRKLRKLRKDRNIVLLSDLHNHVYGRNNEKLLNAVRRIRPDLILISGDMLVGKPGVSFQAAFNFVSRLPEICPVYYANGNHEQRMKENPRKYGNAIYEYRDRLKECGVRFLENESEKLRLDECEIRITGLEFPNRYYRKLKRIRVNREVIQQFLGESDPHCFQILIAHNPVFFPAYRRWGADLTVSGHLHGGIVRLPGIGGVITPQVHLFPRHSGELTQKDEAYLAVSKGLGTHTINVRLFNPAEIVVLHLKTCENDENPI